MTLKQFVPERNLTIYQYIYCIEIGIREFIIEKLSNECGPRWWKERLPGDALEKYKEGRESEKKIKWSSLIPHHPLYYTEFPDLKQTIERKDNWAEVFKRYLQNKDTFINALSELEPIRNKIAHNRKTSETDLVVVKASYKKIITAIGEDYFNELIQKCTLKLDLRDTLSRLYVETESVHKLVKDCKALENIDVWEKIEKEWWFDSIYLDSEINEIKEYIDLIKCYKDLPRSKGKGHVIEGWVNSNDLEKKFLKAKQQFSTILDDNE